MTLYKDAAHAMTSSAVFFDESNTDWFSIMTKRLYDGCATELYKNVERLDNYDILDVKITPTITIMNNYVLVVMTGVMIYQFEDD